MKRVFILFVLVLAGIYSCKTEFDVNAPAQDITVVFGLLDQGEMDHYIRISKAFIGESDALVMAQDPANSTYDDILDVSVEEYSSGNLIHTFYCVRIEINDKEAGTFYYPTQVLYKFSGTLNPSNIYKLVIQNRESGKMVSAETGLIGDFNVEKPYYNPSNPQIGFVNSNGDYTSSDTKWKSAKNGRLFEPVFRFNYKEVDLTTHDTVDKFVDWKLASQKSAFLTGNEIMQANYESESFYKYIESQVPVDYNKYRILGKVDFIMSVGSDDLNTYIDLNQPSNSIIQERPAFTNVGNGIGIFSCRHTKKLSYNLSAYSIDKFLNGEYTSQLGFH